MANLEELDMVQIILNLLEDKFKSTFKSYVYGVPEEKPQSLAPFIMVGQPGISEIVLGCTGSDLITEDIVIMVIVNKKNDFGNRNSGAYSLKTIKDLVIGYARNATSNRIEIDTNTILGYLRQQLNLVNSEGQARVYGAMTGSVSFDGETDKAGTIWEFAQINLKYQRKAGVLSRT